MRRIIHAGGGDVEALSRRHVLRTAGFDVVSASDFPDAERLAREQGAQLIVLEPSVNGQRTKTVAPSSVPVLDLGQQWSGPQYRACESELALAVCALLRLNATEQALRESDARFRSVADAAPVLIWSAGVDRCRDYFNQPWLYFTGRAMEEELGEGWVQGVHPEDRNRCVSVGREAFEAHADFEIEYRLHHRDGSYRWLLERAVPRYTPDGIFAGYAGSCIDITERKNIEAERERLFQAQVALREQAETSERRSAFLGDIADLLSAGLESGATLNALACKSVPLLADACLIELIESSGNARRAGCACARPETAQVLDLYAARIGLGEYHCGAAAEAAFTGSPVVVEQASREWMERAELDGKHGKLLENLGVHRLLCLPMIAFGERLGAVSFFLLDPKRRFTTADVQLAQEMASRIALGLRNRMLFAEAQSARRQAEAANRVKNDFLATMSHELRQPVHAIAGWVRLLKTGRLPAQKTTYALEVIEQNVELQSQIVKDLLDVSAMITGQLYLEVQPIALKPVIEAALRSVHSAAHAKSITLTAQLGEAVGCVHGDAKRLQQVVWNLVYNAIKFTPRGGHVEVGLSDAAGQAQISVIDNGPGIDAQFLPYVFDHFRQQDSTTTRRHGGLGLGLAIVRHVVELHGGSVRADNIGPGRGAMFLVCLPYESQSMQPLMASTSDHA